MPDLPAFTAREAEDLLLRAGFVMAHSSGSHRICIKDRVRVVVPFHAGRMLHPKVVKRVFKGIVDARNPTV